jgi:hypothetical protein
VKDHWAAPSTMTPPMPVAGAASGAAEVDGIAFVEGGNGPVATNDDLIELPSIP